MSEEKKPKKRKPGKEEEEMLGILKDMLMSSLRNNTERRKRASGESPSLNDLFKNAMSGSNSKDMMERLHQLNICSNTLVMVDEVIKVKGLGKVLEDIRLANSKLPRSTIEGVPKDILERSWDAMIEQLTMLNEQVSENRRGDKPSW